MSLYPITEQLLTKLIWEVHLMKQKRLLFIGGTMGVGKTTLGKYLVDQKLENAAFLDGD
ncbi:hypothetical protein HMPREF0496_2537 [Lentilactobacillus hilgardii ATCC 27305]|jgi:predicted AAA+ superfamily ATPase|nr:hypothetical protein HMPREF0496_2537 [Lentilactobacillus hilgardii ATCC 27305]